MDFRIYYADGTTYDGDPFEARALGVLVIVERDTEFGRRLVSNGDYYVWYGAHWRAVDYPGMVQYLVEPGPRRVLLGITVENESWNDAMRRAYVDPDFPAKTGWARGEERVSDD